MNLTGIPDRGAQTGTGFGFSGMTYTSDRVMNFGTSTFTLQVQDSLGALSAVQSCTWTKALAAPACATAAGCTTQLYAVQPNLAQVSFDTTAGFNFYNALYYQSFPTSTQLQANLSNSADGFLNYRYQADGVRRGTYIAAANPNKQLNQGLPFLSGALYSKFCVRFKTKGSNNAADMLMASWLLPYEHSLTNGAVPSGQPSGWTAYPEIDVSESHFASPNSKATVLDWYGNLNYAMTCSLGIGALGGNLSSSVWPGFDSLVPSCKFSSGETRSINFKNNSTAFTFSPALTAAATTINTNNNYAKGNFDNYNTGTTVDFTQEHSWDVVFDYVAKTITFFNDNTQVFQKNWSTLHFAPQMQTMRFYPILDLTSGNEPNGTASNVTVYEVSAWTHTVATGGSLNILTSQVRPQTAGFPCYDCLIALGQVPNSTVVYTDTSGNSNFSIDSSGRVKGFRATAGTDAMSCTATDGTNSGSVSFTITTLAAGGGALALDVSKAPSNGTGNNSCIFQINGLNGKPPYGITLTSQSVAGDFQMSSGYMADLANPGWCCGVLTASTTLNFSICDSAGATATGSVSITKDSVPRHKAVDFSLASQPMPEGMVGKKYRRQVLITSGVTVSSYSVLSGALPTGLTLDSTGKITGTPTTAGDYTATIRAVTNGTPANADQAYSWHITAQRLGVQPAVNPTNGYYVAGPRLYDTNNFEVIARGINVNHYDSSSGPSVILQNSNMVRTFSGPPFGTLSQWMSNFNSMLNGGVIPMWSYNEASAGSISINDLSKMLDNIASYAPQSVALPASKGGGTTTFLNYWNSYGLMNLYNEWGQTPSIVQDVYSAVQMTITSISGNTITCSDTTNPFTASAYTLGRVTIEGVPGVPNKMLTITAHAGSAGAWTFTFSGGTLASSGSGGTLRGGCIGVFRGLGFNCPLTWDGVSYGQNIIGGQPNVGPTQPGIYTIAAFVNNSDPIKSTICCPHVYGGWETYAFGIQTLTKGSTTAVTAKWPTQLQSNYVNAPYSGNPVHGNYVHQFVGVQGVPALNNVLAGITSQGGSTPSFTFSLGINSSGMAGTYVAGSGYMISGLDYRYMTQLLAGLQAQGVCLMMEEVGGATPPLGAGVDPSPSAHTNNMCIRQFEGCGIGWLLWAEDDGPTTPGAGAFAMCGAEAGGNKGIYTSDLGLTGQGKEQWNHPTTSWYALAQPPTDVL